MPKAVLRELLSLAIHRERQQRLLLGVGNVPARVPSKQVVHRVVLLAGCGPGGEIAEIDGKAVVVTREWVQRLRAHPC